RPSRSWSPLSAPRGKTRPSQQRASQQAATARSLSAAASSCGRTCCGGPRSGRFRLVEAEQIPHPPTQVPMDVQAELAAAEERNRQLLEALASRTVLGQATGIIMERYDVDSDHAFALLVRASSRSNRKLREIALQLVAT